MPELNSPAEPNPDDALMCRVARNDADAFGVLVRAHEIRVSRFAMRLLGGDKEAAQDVTQETFLRVWNRRREYVPSGSFSSYLLRIAHRLCLDDGRKNSHAKLVLSDEWGFWDAPDTPFPLAAPSAEHVACANCFADAVKAAVSALPEAQKSVFILSHYENVPHHEIARILDCPIGTIASRKHHAVLNLRRLLAAWNPDKGETK